MVRNAKQFKNIKKKKSFVVTGGLDHPGKRTTVRATVENSPD